MCAVCLRLLAVILLLIGVALAVTSHAAALSHFEFSALCQRAASEVLLCRQAIFFSSVATSLLYVSVCAGCEVVDGS